MNVLGIETSCDETGVALYNAQTGLLADALHSQIDLHAVYGGVVPEIASRDHIRCLLPLIEQVLGEAGIKRPDAIAYTAGPGLVGALMVGGWHGERPWTGLELPGYPDSPHGRASAGTHARG